MKRCNECRFFAAFDEGYSDYTVTNTVVHCLHGKNPHFPCDESYSWDRIDSPDYEQLQVAEKCELFQKGSGITRSVDYDEDFYREYPEDLQELYKNYEE